jgi:hypothetical protein
MSLFHKEADESKYRVLPEEEFHQIDFMLEQSP